MYNRALVRFKTVLLEALRRMASASGKPLAEGAKIEVSSLGALEELIGQHPAELLFAEAAILAARDGATGGGRDKRSTLGFLTGTRPSRALEFSENTKTPLCLSADTVKKAAVAANKSMELIHDLSGLYSIDLFQLLGMRNLSSFVGEVFAKQLRLLAPDMFIANPNQDGYPDLCALTSEGLAYIEKHKGKDGKVNPDKGLWSPFPCGGVEVKATCGNTPVASKTPKPLIGQSRVPLLVSAEWKAHHQETKRLLGIFWDFLDGLPTVLAAFYRNDLDTTVGAGNRDWGAIIRPQDGGGRTTSVSIMKRSRNPDEGVRKMGAGWLILPTHAELLTPICGVFGISPVPTAAPAARLPKR